MTAQVLLLPRDLTPPDVANRTVLVFDVLRATTTMTAALAAGVREIRAFDSIDAARHAAAAFTGPKLLLGEVNCLPPPGFDLGNCPLDWTTSAHAGRTLFMATTNGTRAIAAASHDHPATLLVACLNNARAAAAAAADCAGDITLLCAGSNGNVALEDLLGCGAVLHELTRAGRCDCTGDAAEIALLAFHAAQHDLLKAMRLGAGGRNLIRVGLDADIAACAALNSTITVGEVDPASLSIRPLSPAK